MWTIGAEGNASTKIFFVGASPSPAQNALKNFACLETEQAIEPWPLHVSIQIVSENH